jgi:hypothetical protein
MENRIESVVVGDRDIKPGDAVEFKDGRIGVAMDEDAYIDPGLRRGLVREFASVMSRGVVAVLAAEDVRKGERATALPDASIGGRGDDGRPGGPTFPARRRLDAWWLSTASKGDVGALKLGEPPTEDELRRYAP